MAFIGLFLNAVKKISHLPRLTREITFPHTSSVCEAIIFLLMSLKSTNRNDSSERDLNSEYEWDLDLFYKIQRILLGWENVILFLASWQLRQ